MYTRIHLILLHILEHDVLKVFFSKITDITAIYERKVFK